jgi:hypothetical protein
MQGLTTHLAPGWPGQRGGVVAGVRDLGRAQEARRICPLQVHTDLAKLPRPVITSLFTLLCTCPLINYPNAGAQDMDGFPYLQL